MRAAPVRLRGGDLVGLTDRDLGASEWLVIDQERISLFADATNDHQWIHVEPRRAARGPFGATIAHGYLLLSLVPDLLADVLVLEDEVRGTNVGIDRLRFLLPVRVGDRVRLRARLTDAQLRDDGAVRYRVAVELDVDGAERPALVGDLIFLTYTGRNHHDY
ncbi:MaoC family dehydratase [Microbacterium sp. AGC85]